MGEGGGPNESVYVRKTDGSAAIRLGDGFATSLSADGRSALTIQPDGTRLALLPIGPGEVRSLAYPGIVSISGAWAFPDGRRVLIGGSEKGRGARLYVAGLDGGAPRALAPEGMNFYGVTISPDGSRVTGVGSDGTTKLYSVDESAAPLAVPGVSPREFPIRFSGDGQFLFVSRLDEVPARIFRVRLSSGAREPWLELAPADRAGVSAVRPIKITPDGKSYAYSYSPDLSDLFLVDKLDSQ